MKKNIPLIIVLAIGTATGVQANVKKCNPDYVLEVFQNSSMDGNGNLDYAGRNQARKYGLDISSETTAKPTDLALTMKSATVEKLKTVWKPADTQNKEERCVVTLNDTNQVYEIILYPYRHQAPSKN